MGTSPDTALTAMEGKSHSIRLGRAAPRRASTPDLSGGRAFPVWGPWYSVWHRGEKPESVQGTECSLVIPRHSISRER